MKKTAKELRQRKFYVVVPLIVLPFITMAFWALGGGRVMSEESDDSNQTGLIMDLPYAVLPDDSEFTKLDYYNLAMKDSLKFQQQIRNDPNYHKDEYVLNAGNYAVRSKLISSTNSWTSEKESPEQVIADKLAIIENELSRTPSKNSPSPETPANTTISYSEDIDRLEQMMNSMTNRKSESKELSELNEMLQTILDIQHPELVEKRLKEEGSIDKETLAAIPVGDKIPVLTMSPESFEEELSLQTMKDYEDPLEYPVSQNGFFSFSDWESENIASNTIKAVVHETQTLMNGSLVKLRLTEKMSVGGLVLPRNSYVYGLAQLYGERLKLKIESVTSGNHILPVKLSVYDLDGQEGIYVPGTITHEVVKQSADRSMSLMDVNTLNSTFGLQAATAGINAAKTLLTRNLKPVKVKLNSGYQVVIVDNG